MSFLLIKPRTAQFLYYRITKFIFIKVNFKLKLITKTKGGIKKLTREALTSMF